MVRLEVGVEYRTASGSKVVIFGKDPGGDKTHPFVGRFSEGSEGIAWFTTEGKATRSWEPSITSEWAAPLPHDEERLKVHAGEMLELIERTASYFKSLQLNEVYAGINELLEGMDALIDKVKGEA